MSGLWRSQEMQYCRVIMRTECTNQTLKEIGEHGFFHPVDLGDPLDLADSARAAKKRIDVCRTWENKLSRFRDLMKEFKIKIPLEDYTEAKGGDTSLLGTGDLIEALERHVDPREEELVRNVQFQRSAKAEIVHSIQHQHVLRVVADLHLDDQEILDEKMGEPPAYSSMGKSHTMGTPLLGADHATSLEMTEVKSSGGATFHSYVCGVINQSAQSLFSRMLFRVSRGNAIAGFSPIPGGIVDGSDGDNPVAKSVFYIMLTGQQLRQRVSRLCANFEAAIYETPENREGFERKAAELERQTSDQKAALQKTEMAIYQSLQSFAGTGMASPLHTFELALRKEKAINVTLMKCQFTDMQAVGTCLIYLDGWCPTIEVNNLKDRLNLAFRNIDPAPVFHENIETNSTPPTYFRTNKFTSVYQGLVDTYGIARYQEVNPGLFTIVTFPFLFGVMYGDFGHGIFLTLFATYLIYNEEKMLEQKKRGKMNEIMVMIFGGRYMLILMGLFAIYIGTIYNDCMAIPMHFFDSMWKQNSDDQFERVEGRVYPWGIDYEWYNKRNELFFLNSLKMKLSVILGVTQMTFGVCLSACNHIYFKDKISLFFEFIPQLLFLLCTFGYMVVIIFMKWVIHYDNTSLAPNLIQTMIGMFLSPGSLPTVKDPLTKEDIELELFAGQANVQLILVLIAVCTVPVMLIVKPIMQHKLNQQNALRAGNGFGIQDDMEMSDDVEGGGHGPSDHTEDDAHGLSDLMIHQAIHTIEFVLGCVSNTASYLRLWALSLAHAQLAQVFWEKMMVGYGIEALDLFGGVIGFAAWFGATFFVLLCMDVLECFLHALRLHWVEFQNKFYKADGYQFEPFTFSADGNE